MRLSVEDAMSSFPQTFEVIGPLAVKALAFAAGLAVFAPLLAAFAAPFFA